MSVRAPQTDPGARRSLFAASGALLCGAAVALAAWASHGVEPMARERLQPAVLMLFVHGLALCVFGRDIASDVMQRLVLGAWLAGVLLFCGSLVGSVAFGWPTTLAPGGGGLLILAWLAQTLRLLQRRS